MTPRLWGKSFLFGSTTDVQRRWLQGGGILRILMASFCLVQIARFWWRINPIAFDASPLYQDFDSLRGHLFIQWPSLLLLMLFFALGLFHLIAGIASLNAKQWVRTYLRIGWLVFFLLLAIVGFLCWRIGGMPSGTWTKLAGVTAWSAILAWLDVK